MKKKIAFVMPSLEGGGAERVTVNLINNLDPTKFEVLLILGKNEGKLKAALATRIKTYDLKVNRMSKGIMGIVKILAKEKPDVIFSVMGYVNIICLLINLFLGNKCSLVLTEHSTVSLEYKKSPTTMMKIQKHLRKLLYPRASRVVCVSKGVKEDLENFLDVKLKNASVMYNPILDDDYSENIEEVNHEWLTKENFVLVTAGRLVPEKGFNYLIEAMNELVNNKREVNIKLLILGEGSERGNLETLINQYGLENNIKLLGFQKNVKGYFVKSDLFVLSSICEGLPTVLIEAMGLKLPVISTDCPSGPEEIIRNEEQGLLVPVKDPFRLAQAILTLKNNENHRVTLKEEGYVRAMDFRTKKIVKEYEKLFEEVVK